MLSWLLVGMVVVGLSVAVLVIRDAVRPTTIDLRGHQGIHLDRLEPGEVAMIVNHLTTKKT